MTIHRNNNDRLFGKASSFLRPHGQNQVIRRSIRNGTALRNTSKCPPSAFRYVEKSLKISPCRSGLPTTIYELEAPFISLPVTIQNR
jgi:hypothetical protein